MLNITLEEDKRLRELLTDLTEESKSKISFLIDKSGQLISRSNSPDLSSDEITFASLTAGNVAASEALSKLLGDKNLDHMFTEAGDEGIYMILVDDKFILVVIFNREKSNLGIVRVKVKKYYPEILKILRTIVERTKSESAVSEEINIDDIDLDSLFE